MPRKKKKGSDDDESDEGDGDEDEDYNANGDAEDDDEDDADDSDFSEEEDLKPKKKRAAKAKRAPAAKPSRSKKARKDSDSEEEEEEEDEEEEADEDSDEEEEAQSSGASEESDDSEDLPKSKRKAAAARPRRQAAAQASKRLKSCDDDDDEDEEEEGAPGTRGGDASDEEDEEDERGGGGGSRGGDEALEDDDEEYARQLDRAMNGPRPTRTSRGTSGPYSQQQQRSQAGGGSRSRGAAGGGGAYKPPPRKQQRHNHRTSARAVAKVSYAESDDSDSDGSGGGRRGGGGAKPRHEPLPAFEEGENFDDEVEKVLAHRELQQPAAAAAGTGGGADAPPAPDPSDPWASRELFIKWKRYSYIHCSWDTKATLSQLGGYKRVLNYMRRVDEMEASRPYVSREEQELRDVERQMEEQLNQQHSQVERVCGQKPNDSGEGLKYLVKWEGLPYSEMTWEVEEDVTTSPSGPAKIQEFQAREARLQQPNRSVDTQRKMFKQQSTRALQEQPAFLQFGKLRDYQLDGLNWMVYSWSQDRNAILADEMGLGKTVQCVSFLGYLAEVLSIHGPFLVVVPLSTVPNWIREFRRWTPMLNVVVYVGDSRSREAIRAFEFDVDRRAAAAAASEPGCVPRQTQFEVLITTYELILKDAPILNRIKWNYLIVDEAHRLKNAESALYQELISFSFTNKLLVTGTPLQNSLRELWALLHFLEPDKFPDNEAFEEEYSLQTMDGVSGLHAVLRPHLLRRVIKEVEKSLPPKNERILRVEMTPLQRQYYKWILTRNFKELNKGTRGGGHVSLLNIICELKKCCNHPFLFESAEEGYRGQEGDRSVVDRLILTSGKMVLLDKLLRRLKETGHRVLIFSQMVRALDIISDYMRLRGFQHQRLDGSTPAAARHQSMEQFNHPDSTDFAFLLSTRAGGLGINLATADTVVIFDSDWNPQNDLQAMSRAHRIGQTETVNIYRLVTSGSVEEDILERAKKKMVLDHLVIQRMDTSGRMVLDPSDKGAGGGANKMFGKDELAAILRFGAEELFKQEARPEDVAEKERRMFEEDIDAILERAEVVDSRHDYPADADGEGGAGEGAARDGGEGAGGPGELLSSFNVATFKNEEDDATFWSRLIPVTVRPKEEEELLPRRLRTEDDLESPHNGGRARGPAGAGAAGPSAGGGDGKGGARAHRREQRSKGGSVSGGEPGPPVEGAILRVEEWLLDVDAQGALLKDAQDPEAEVNVRTLSRRDANAFVRAVKRYGLESRVAEICTEASSRSFEDVTPGQQLALFHTLLDGCRRAVDMAGEDPKDAILDFFGAAVKAQELVQVHSHMRHLERCVQPHLAKPSGFTLAHEWQCPLPKWGKAMGWGPRDDAMLLIGVYLYGLGHWDKVAADERLKLGEKLASVVAPGAAKGKAAAGKDEGGDGAEDAPAAAGHGPEEKGVLPKASHLDTRVQGLLRKMHQAKKAKQIKPAAPPKKKPAAGAARGASLTKAAMARQQKDEAGAAAAAAGAVGLGRGPAEASGVGGKRKAGQRDGGAGSGPGSTAAGMGAREGSHGLAAKGRSGSGSGRAGEGAGGGAGLSGAHHRESERDRDKDRERDGEREDKRQRTGDVPSANISSKEAGELLAESKADIKALRKLQRHAGELDAAECAARTKELLGSIGTTIDRVVARKGEGWGLPLWEQVAKVTEGGMSGSRLQAVYAKIKATKQAGAAATGGGHGGQGGAATVPGGSPGSSRQQQGAARGDARPQGEERLGGKGDDRHHGSSSSHHHHHHHGSSGQQQEQHRHGAPHASGPSERQAPR